MTFRIKDYARFQHFKDRNPPWIKLYRDILDDPDWHDLDADSAKILVMLWLIASEDETKNGKLPDNRRLCFRLRISERELAQALIKLSHWLEQDVIEVISDRYHDDAPETETEKEPCSPSASESADDGFAEFWNAYGKKAGKSNSIKEWKKLKPDAELARLIISAAARYSSDREQKYRKDPERWLKGRLWEDEPDSNSASAGIPNAGLKVGDTRTRHGVDEVFTAGAGWVPA